MIAVVIILKHGHHTCAVFPVFPGQFIDTLQQLVVDFIRRYATYRRVSFKHRNIPEVVQSAEDAHL